MKRSSSNLEYAVYCCSIIIGAGILTMTLRGRSLGFVPLVILTVLVGLWLMWIYRRMADTIFRDVQHEIDLRTELIRPSVAAGIGISTGPEWKDHIERKIRAIVVEKGAELFDALIARAGIGWTGYATLAVGMFFYVFFADIVYLTIGNRSLNAVAAELKRSGEPVLTPMLALGLVLIVGSSGLPAVVRRPTARMGAIQKFLAMGGSWLIGIAVLTVIDGESRFLLSANRYSAVGLSLFLLAVMAGMFTGRTTGRELEQTGGLNPQHRVNVLVTYVELALLLVTGCLILLLFAINGRLEQFYAFAPGWLDPSQLPAWSTVLGIVIFAYVGTGLYNISGYPELFTRDPGGSKKPRFVAVVALGTLIPMVVYVLWTAVTAFTLNPQELALADAAGQGSHIPIANKAAMMNPQAAWVITLTGYLFALMAVTSACNGFTESLSDRMRITLRHMGHQKAATRDYRLAILLLAMVAALAKDVWSAQVDISVILSIAGNAGGGLLLLILPLFFPYPLGERTRARYWEVAAAVVVAAFLSYGIITAEGGGSGAAGEVITAIKWGVGLVVAVMTALLVFSEPAEPRR